MGDSTFKIDFSDAAKEDLRYFARTGQTSLIKKIKKLLDAIVEDPAKGIGKPELLKHNLAGRYSRRIDREHRIVYKVIADTILILSLKGHYE